MTRSERSATPVRESTPTWRPRTTRAGHPTERAFHQAAAYEAIEALVAINLAQARDAARDAERWDDLGTVVGIGAAILLVAVGGALVVWLRSRAFTPLFGLAAAMHRFGRGDLHARATERGPEELREMCLRFNEMAASIAAQRQAQMTFLGGVAHDLRNPLSALRMSVALLDPATQRPSEELRRRTLERVDRQITRMDRLLGDFLDIAKIEASELELRLNDHDARTLVEHVVELFDGVSPAHRLTRAARRTTP